MIRAMDDDDRRAARLIGEMILANDDDVREQLLEQAMTGRPRVLALSLAATIAMLGRAMRPEQLSDIAHMMLLDPDLN